MAKDYRIFNESILKRVASSLTSGLSHKRSDGSVCSAERAIQEVEARVGSDALNIGEDCISAINGLNNSLNNKITQKTLSLGNVLISGSGYATKRLTDYWTDKPSDVRFSDIISIQFTNYYSCNGAFEIGLPLNSNFDFYIVGTANSSITDLQVRVTYHN